MQSFRFEDSLQMYVLCDIVEGNGYEYTSEVRTLNNYNLLKTNLESILSASKIPYELSEPLTDGNPDLNYFIQVDIGGKSISFAPVECILYLRESDFTMNLLVLNISGAEEGGKLNTLYKIVNDVNDYVSNGNFIVCQERQEIIYKSSVYCGRDFCNLSGELLSFQLMPFRRGIEMLIGKLT